MPHPVARPRRLASVLLATGLLAAACSAAPGSSSAPPVEQPSSSLPTATGDAIGAIPEGLVAAIREDLEVRLGIDTTNATVVSAESVAFSDGSLGCPKPGMVYTQAIVEGYRVILEVDGRQYDYRARERGAPVLCEKGPPGVGG